jgi:hypothetical protein
MEMGTQEINFGTVTESDKVKLAAAMTLIESTNIWERCSEDPDFHLNMAHHGLAETIKENLWQ